MNGPIRRLYGSTLLVSESAMYVRPGKAPPKAMTAGRPVARRATFTAFSTASAPELKKAACLPPRPGTGAARRSASGTKLPSVGPAVDVPEAAALRPDNNRHHGQLDRPRSDPLYALQQAFRSRG